MRCATPISCLAAAGLLLFQPGGVPALAEAHGPAVDLRERVFFDRSAAPSTVSEEPAIVALQEGRLSANAINAASEMMPVGKGGAAVTVVATLSPKDAPLLDTGLPPWAVPRPMPWVTSPAVPRPLSEPPPQIETIEKIRVPEDEVPALPEPLFTVKAYPRATERHAARPSLSNVEHTQTLLPGSPKISSQTGDPIAALEFEEEPPAVPPIVAPAFIMPFANGRVTSGFNQGRRHPAIDLGGALGSSVFATTVKQTVVFAGWRGGYGNAVIARDAIGRLHLYGHLQKIIARVGQVLDQGTKLGHLGSTGHSTGPHVHYEVRDSKGGHINPMMLLFGRTVSNGLAWGDPYRKPRPTAVALVTAQPRPR
jgi:murein DD-endopeptidase MepM/ murein hydrolase activator NlpD